MANTAVYSSIIYHLLFVAESAQNRHMAMALGSVIHRYRTDGQVQGIGRRKTSMQTISIRPMAGGPVVEATIVHRREANFKYGIPYLRTANKEILYLFRLLGKSPWCVAPPSFTVVYDTF